MSLKAIASVLGLSVTTVSRALNGYEDVAKQTRQRVEEEAQRRGYRPNVAARRLKTGRANAVGLVYPMTTSALNDTHFNKILLALDQRLSQHDIDLVLLTDKPHDGQRSLIRMLRSRAVDAIVVTHTSPHDERLLSLQQKGVSFLTLGRSDSEQNHAWFDVDHAAGSALAVKHCLSLGMQRIAWLGGDTTCTFVRDRRQGYLNAMDSVPPYATAVVAPSRRAGYQQTTDWLAQGLQPQAIITDCSALAEGALVALQQAGRLEGDTAVTLVAWDGLPVDAIIDHPVIAIRQASEQQRGEQVAMMVMRLLEGAPLAELQILWQPCLQFPK
ncbi:LacI family DNA-binding transcriptional regulator [Pantoea ananatis]|uniref:LacI family DNA-binding transcriptional regulator n=1 Tax=Pantoea ananas TaxID=553 RepID=UPI000B7C89A9|nr:LacI family DNA-binding transcriptional regulator [Pantoea ananatis]MBN6031886.1 LacI family DNA-binding transcriptional regulator [Pantoea ananatis]MCK0551542.1 LacI family transcriptional regulator [Pantoea ananatis]MCW0313337.1 HTH-type transcriptional regulator RafR [Pantoea ananatis]MCW0349733.1 HTH-type transcriptional regulator RafR [Pantoea ananatis]MDC7859963.1 transcriptional regulator [Pantoea ananatis]